MPYTKTSWVDGTTPITAAELNRMEDGIEDAHAGDIDEPIYAGRVNSSSSPTISPGPTGWTVTRDALGLYRVVHNLALSSGNYVVVVSAETLDDVGVAYIATVRQRQADAFLVELFTAAGAPADIDFSFFMRVI